MKSLRELLYYNNLSLRDNRRNIVFSYPQTKEEEKMFKDILDQGCDVCFPVFANTTALSELSQYPIEIEFYDEHGQLHSTKIGPYYGLKNFIKNRYTLYETIYCHINSNSVDTLKWYSKIKHSLTIKDYVY